MRARPGAVRRRGFTLLELVVAVSILALMVGMVVPVASTMLRSKARRVTRAELEELAAATTEYVRDTGVFPSRIRDLLQQPRRVSGWSGPYLATDTADPLSGDSSWESDGWTVDYELTLASDVLTIASGGDDGTVGTSDDIDVRIDAAPVRRASTLDVLGRINLAVELYNAQYLPDDPLSTSYPILLDRLVDTGFLPTTSGYEEDAWGDPFEPDPPGASPVVAVRSTNVGG